MRGRERRLLPILCLLAAAAVLLGESALRRVNPGNGFLPGDGDIPPVLAETGPLDLNTAREAELAALPGIGPQRAERILAWREEHGPFRGEEDLLSVPDIGAVTWEAIRPYITFG